MFERLTERLGDAFRNLSGRGRISEANVAEVMGEVRTALLEADVNVEVKPLNAVAPRMTTSTRRAGSNDARATAWISAAVTAMTSDS